jgi:hypothetical protein
MLGMHLFHPADALFSASVVATFDTDNDFMASDFGFNNNIDFARVVARAIREFGGLGNHCVGRQMLLEEKDDSLKVVAAGWHEADLMRLVPPDRSQGHAR